MPTSISTIYKKQSKQELFGEASPCKTLLHKQDRDIIGKHEPLRLLIVDTWSPGIIHRNESEYQFTYKIKNKQKK